jgi:phage shock protein A
MELETIVMGIVSKKDLDDTRTQADCWKSLAENAEKEASKETDYLVRAVSYENACHAYAQSIERFERHLLLLRMHINEMDNKIKETSDG